MDISPLAYVGSSLHQVAFVVRNLEAAQNFFNETMGVPRVLGRHADRTHRTYLRRNLLQGVFGSQGRGTASSRLLPLRSRQVRSNATGVGSRGLRAIDKRQAGRERVHILRHRSGNRFDNGNRVYEPRGLGAYATNQARRLLVSVGSGASSGQDEVFRSSRWIIS